MAQDLSIWSCVALTLLSSVLMIAVVLRAPWKPAREEQQAEQRQRQRQPGEQRPMDGAAPEVHEPVPLSRHLSSSAEATAHGHAPFAGVADEEEDSDGVDGVARAHVQERQWRFVTLGSLLQGAAVLLLVIGVAINVWGEVSLATYAPLSPSDPEVRPVRVELSFGLGGRRVRGAADAADGRNGTDPSAWAAGAYSAICTSRAVLGCAVGFQAGVASVLAHALLALACAMALLLYLLLVRGCVPALGQRGQSRPKLLAVAWRVALLHCISAMMCPVMWAAASDASLRWNLKGTRSDGRRSVVRLGPSWIVLLVSALLAPLLLWNTRRVLQLLHSPDWKGESRRFLALAHEYHQAPGMALVPLQSQSQPRSSRHARPGEQEERKRGAVDPHGQHLLSVSDRERVGPSSSPPSAPRLAMGGARPALSDPSGAVATTTNRDVRAPPYVDPELALDDLEEL